MLSLPAVLVGTGDDLDCGTGDDLDCGTGDDPGSEGDPVTVVCGSEAREHSG